MHFNQDLNWFWSTLAQSGAAIVAIMAGFLLNRVLNYRKDMAEYKGLQEAINTCNGKAAELKDKISEICEKEIFDNPIYLYILHNINEDEFDDLADRLGRDKILDLRDSHLIYE